MTTMTAIKEKRLWTSFYTIVLSMERKVAQKSNEVEFGQLIQYEMEGTDWGV